MSGQGVTWFDIYFLTLTLAAITGNRMGWGKEKRQRPIRRLLKGKR